MAGKRHSAPVLCDVILGTLVSLILVQADQAGIADERKESAAARSGEQTPAQAPEERGVLVLDNGDPRWDGRDFYFDNLTRLDRSGGIRFRIGGFNSSQTIGSNHQIARDRVRDSIWVIENVAHRIRRFDGSGKELLSLKGIEALAIAVDPPTGNLWVLTSDGTIYGKDTVVLDPDGRRLSVHDAKGFDIACDSKNRAMVIAGKDLTKVDVESGKVLFRRPIAQWCASSVAVDPRNGNIWVAVRSHPQAGGQNELLAFDENGANVKTIALAERDPFRVSVDSQSGAVWVVNAAKSVLRYAPDGRLTSEFPFEAFACEADAQTGGAWVVTPEATLLIDPTGKTVVSVKHKVSSFQAWIVAE